MKNSQEIIGVLEQQGLLPLFFHADKNIAASVLKALYRGGIRVVEFTNRGPEALDNFTYLKKLRDAEMPGLYLGAGTIKTKAEALAYIEQGTDFIISPGLHEEVCTAATSAGTFWIPGCMTPSEIMKAERLAAKVIKIFPGNILGPGFVSAVKEVFPNLKFIPTGGVLLEQSSLQNWFGSGVIAVGAGSTLISKTMLTSGDFSSLETRTGDMLKLVASSR